MTGIDESKAERASAAQGLVQALDTDSPLALLHRRCKDAHIDTEWDSAAERNSSPRWLFLRIFMANGKGTRVRTFSDRLKEQALNFLNANFENVKFLSSYQAVYYGDDRTIEAGIRTPLLIRTALASLPGIQKLDSPESSSDAEDDDQAFPGALPKSLQRSYLPRGPWKAEFENVSEVSWRAEIGSYTPRFGALNGRISPDTATIRISGINAERHDELVDILEKVANAVFFECEVKYGIVALLESYPLYNRRIRRQPAEAEDARPVAPRLQYQQEALALYTYACSAQDMPLLQFLAYYQVLEFYFPSYARREVLTRLRNQLKDPTFQLQKDADLGRIIATVKRFGSGYGNEQDQLRATIRACVDEEQLRGLVRDDGKYESITSGSSVIKGLNQLRSNDKQADIRDQVASRVYDIRCRIVHTKDEANDRVPELLLPFSKEAGSLGPDIALLKYLAQKTLIANAEPLRI